MGGCCDKSSSEEEQRRPLLSDSSQPNVDPPSSKEKTEDEKPTARHTEAPQQRRIFKGDGPAAQYFRKKYGDSGWVPPAEQARAKKAKSYQIEEAKKVA